MLIPYCVGGLRLNLKITGFYTVLTPQGSELWLHLSLKDFAFLIIDALIHLPPHRNP